MGLAQFWAVRQRFRSADWWILVSGLGLAIASLAGGALSEGIIESGGARWDHVPNIFFGWVALSRYIRDGDLWSHYRLCSNEAHSAGRSAGSRAATVKPGLLSQGVGMLSWE